MYGNEYIIYGAGMVGKLVYESLKIHGLEQSIIGFAVSKKNGLQDHYCGIPVYEIAQLVEKREDAIVIISVFPETQKSMEINLMKLGFKKMYKISMSNFVKMSERYIEEFNVTHPVYGDIDILYFASDNNSASGAFLCLVDLVMEINKKGISTLVVLPEYGDGEDILFSKGVRFTYIPSSHWGERVNDNSEKFIENNSFNQEISEKRIADIIKNNHVKLVHNNTIYTYIGAKVAFEHDIPVVWHLREFIIEQGFWFKNEEYAYEMLNKAASIISVSNYVKRCYKKLNSDNVKVIYDGLAIEKYYLKRSILERNKVVTIVMVGALTNLKGQDELIEAVRILKEDSIIVKVQLVGKGDYDYIETLKKRVAKYNLQEQIEFLGYQSNMKAIYDKADIAVVCSKAEAFGRATIEGQLAGCIVIGAKKGATPELIEDKRTGFLYNSGSPIMLAEKIKYILKERKRARKVAKNGQVYALNKYTKENNANEIMNVYKCVVEDFYGR